MRNKDEVFLLFKFSHNPPGEEVQGSDTAEQGRYQVIFFFDYNGEIDFTEFKKADISIGQNYENPVFKTKEDLTDFADKFINANSYQSLYLLSANDYNIGIESCHDLHAFREIFKRYGHAIENKSQNSKSIFGKLF